MSKLSPRQKKLTRLHRISFMLDKAIPIPGTKWRIGLDPILGLIPGGGDTIAGVLSAYIVWESARMGVNRKVIGQMVTNVLLDSLAGSVPVVGDVFDVTWKANVRNIELLEHHLNYTPENRKVNKLFLIGLSVVLILIVLGFTLFTLALVTTSIIINPLNPNMGIKYNDFNTSHSSSATGSRMVIIVINRSF